MNPLKRLSRGLLGAAAAFALIQVTAAHAVTIKFEELPHLQSSYSEAGFAVSFLSGVSWTAPCMCGNDTVFPLSVGEEGSPTMSIAAIDRRPFTFAGFDGVVNPYAGPPFLTRESLTVTGLRPDSTVFEQVFDLGDSGDFRSFTSGRPLDPFIEIHFLGPTVFGSDWGIDNVRVCRAPSRVASAIGSLRSLIGK